MLSRARIHFIPGKGLVSTGLAALAHRSNMATIFSGCTSIIWLHEAKMYPPPRPNIWHFFLDFFHQFVFRSIPSFHRAVKRDHLPVCVLQGDRIHSFRGGLYSIQDIDPSFHEIGDDWKNIAIRVVDQKGLRGFFVDQGIQLDFGWLDQLTVHLRRD